MSDRTIDPQDELYAALVELARLRQQLERVRPYALIGAGVMSGSMRVHGGRKPDEEAADLYRALREGGFQS